MMVDGEQRSRATSFFSGAGEASSSDLRWWGRSKTTSVFSDTGEVSRSNPVSAGEADVFSDADVGSGSGEETHSISRLSRARATIWQRDEEGWHPCDRRKAADDGRQWQHRLPRPRVDARPPLRAHPFDEDDDEEGDQKIHILDFDICHGSQYMTLIHALAERQPTKPTPKITAVNDSNSMANRSSVDPLRTVDERLKKLAERVGVGLRFNVLYCRAAELWCNSFGSDPDESLAVNFAFRLYRMVDKSVLTANPRDELLCIVKGLTPTVVTLVEQNLNTNTTPFLPWFNEAWAHYKALFDSLDSTMSQD